MDAGLGRWRYDSPRHVAQTGNTITRIIATELGERDFPTALVNDKVGALVSVDELDWVRQSDVHAMLERAYRGREPLEAASAPVERTGIVGIAEQREDALGAFGLARPGVFGQSGRVGAAQRVSPDPPAEPYVQLSLHTALRCDNTIHVPGIGQASTV